MTDQANASPSAADAGTARLWCRQVEVLYDQLSVALVASDAAALILGALFWTITPPHRLIGWLAAFLLLTAWRCWTLLAYRRAGAEARCERRWFRWFLLGTSASGIVWGAAIPLLPPADSPLHLGFTVLWVCGLSAGAVASLSAVRLAFFSFLLVAQPPAALYLIFTGGPEELTVGAALLMFFGFLSFNALRMHRTINQSLRLQFQNSDLIEDLANEKRRIERMNAELEARIAERTAELRAANATKTRFLAAASHDLRQPLHTLALLQNTLTHRVTDAQAQGIVAQMGESLRVMKGQLDALLDINQLDGGAITPSVHDFPIQDLFARLAREFSPHAQEKGLALRVVDSRTVVRSDPALLEGILRNLLSNAVHYTDTGKVLLGPRRRGDHLRIEVWDTGIGIPPEQTQAIFTEFYQLDNASRERGKGLGLAIVERTARLLGHPVDVRSVLGRGSTFSITVPLGVQPAVAEEPTGAPEPMAAPVGESRCIVLVEDDEDVLAATRFLLEMHGLRIESGRTGAEIVPRCERGDCVPDLVIADYRLLNAETGIEVLERIRIVTQRHLPGFILTGDISSEVAAEAQAHDCQVFQKPVDPEQLVRSIFGAVDSVGVRA